MRYAARLAALPTAGSVVGAHAAYRVVLLTGQSAYRHCQLSPDQFALLAPLQELGFAVVAAGFPYHRELLTHPYRREPILPASARNASQFVAASWSPRFREQLGRHLRPVVERTERGLLVITGSSGLHLWAAARPALHPPPGLAVRLLALGPVAGPRTLQRVAATGVAVDIVRGESDWLSRLGHGGRVGHAGHLGPAGHVGPVTTIVPGGHLDYVGAPAVRDAVRAAARALLQQTREPTR
jgi:hypothetical protein